MFVISNQSGIGRGHFSEEQLEELHIWLMAELAKYGAHIDGFTIVPIMLNLALGSTRWLVIAANHRRDCC